jgi:outer membrane protein
MFRKFEDMNKGILKDKLIFVAGFFFFLFSNITAQKLLTSEEAINIALKNNFDILIARTTADIDKINNTSGNAGMLPNIGITASDNKSLNNNLSYKLASAPKDTTTPNSATNSLIANVSLNWTVFDGLKMFVTKKKLNEIEVLGEIQFKQQVLQSIYDVTLAYFNVVMQKQQLSSLLEVINYNTERVKILQTSFDAGLSAKNNLLQAKIDLNVFQENAINQQSVIISSKRNLNQLLGQDSENSFEVTDSIFVNFIPDRKSLELKIAEVNPSIMVMQSQVEIARLSVKELNSLRMPKLNFTAGYYFTRTDNTAGFQLFNRNFGPQVGGTLSIPIFQGGNINRQVSAAKLQLQAAQYGLDVTKLQINVQLENAITEFEEQQRLLNIELANDALAKENLDISMQRLRLGQTTALEVRQAQESYVDSRTRLINFSYNLKVAETHLKQLIAAL